MLFSIPVRYNRYSFSYTRAFLSYIMLNVCAPTLNRGNDVFPLITNIKYALYKFHFVRASQYADNIATKGWL